jgi:HAD domain in Swiss Army Knife RNA repair proteins
MKILFLDFDGCLKPIHQEFSKEACKLVSDMLIKDPTLRIVVSSSWREQGLQACRGILASLGIDPIKVIGVTPGMPEHALKTRDHHIKVWLREHPGVDNFVIFDDIAEMPDFKHKYVQPDPKVGLTSKDIEKALKILSKKGKY